MKVISAAILALVFLKVDVANSAGSYLTAPNSAHDGQAAPVRSATLLTCGQPGEIEGTTISTQHRQVFQIDFGSNSADAISFTSCNHSDYDTGLSLWRWDPTDAWATTTLTQIAQNDNGAGCLSSSIMSFNAKTEFTGQSQSYCYFLQVGGGSSEQTQQYGSFDVKMNCGSGSNNYVTDCTTPSPTPSPTPAPTSATPAPVTPSPTEFTWTPCCITHQASHQDDCEEDWQDESACNDHGSDCKWWSTDDGTCDLCCLPKNPQAPGDVAICAAVSTEAGCTSGACYWSGMAHCN